MKSIKKVCCIVLTALLAILCLEGSLERYSSQMFHKNVKSVQAEEVLTVKIGYYPIDGFITVNSEGKAEGYQADYLSSIAMLTGWNYEFIEVENLLEGEELLAQHVIDFLAPCQLTKKGQTRFSYSAYPFGTEYSVLITSPDNTDYYYEDCESFENMSVALVEGYPMTDHFKDYMKNKGFRINPVYYDDMKTAFEALDSGRVDGMVTDLMETGDHYRILARFSPSPFYYMTWKGNNMLLEELNNAMSILKTSEPDLENTLLEAHFPVYREQQFTKQELEYIQKLGTVKVAYVDELPPLSFTDKATGKIGGISSRIFERIEQVSGLNFEYEALPKGNVTYQYLQEHDFDLITGARFNRSNLNAYGIMLSSPYLDAKMVMVGNKNMVFDKNEAYSIAVVAGSKTLIAELHEQYPLFEIVNYDSPQECFDEVRKGSVQLLLLNQYVVEYWLSKPKYENLGMVPVEGLDDQLCFSSIVKENRSTADNVMLINIINKALSQIPQDELDAIVVRENMTNRYEYTLTDILYRYRVGCIIACIALIFAGVILYYVMMLRRRERKQREKEAELLLLQQKRYKLVLDNSDDMMYELGIECEANIVSDRIQEKFGWSIPKQIKEPTLEKIMQMWHICPEDEEKVKTFINRINIQKRSGREVVRLQKNTGEYIWCAVTGFPLLDAEDHLVSVVGKIEDVDADTKARKKLEQETRTDGMTGLINKTTFASEVIAYINKYSAYNTAIIFIDMDHFKDINDKMGHTMGDHVICDTARKLQTVFANCDLVARFGGDEFCAFVKDIPYNTLTEKLHWMVEKLRSVYTNGLDYVEVTASIGAAYCMEEDIQYQYLMDMADGAVYEAKKNGRNQCIIRTISKSVRQA